MKNRHANKRPFLIKEHMYIYNDFKPSSDIAMNTTGGMMVKNVIMIAVLGSLAGVLQTNAMQPYVSVKGGLGVMQDADFSDSMVGTGQFSFDTGFALDIAAGVTPFEGTPIRTELAYIYQKNDIDTATIDGLGSASINGDATLNAGFFNVYYDFENTSPVTPFVSAGVGVANVNGDAEGSSSDDTVLAYQLGAGVDYGLSEEVAAELQYRYLSMQDPDLDGTKIEIASHQILIGLRYSF